MGSTKVKMVETLDVDTSVKKEKELEREPWGAAKFEGSEKGQRNGRGGVRSCGNCVLEATEFSGRKE